MLAPQLSEGSAGGHLHHGAAVLVRHEQPPDFVVSGYHVLPHVDASEEHFLPVSRLCGNLRVVEDLTRPRPSRLSEGVPVVIVFLQCTEFLEGLILAQPFPEVNTAVQFPIDRLARSIQRCNIIMPF